MNRAVDTVTLLGLLRRRSPRFFELAEVVGRWVWIQFERPPEVDTRQRWAQLSLEWKTCGCQPVDLERETNGGMRRFCDGSV
ncbi:MAG TPA: hypothetical protein VFV96_16585 [Verrucomicrobiae bacterium]|nr:hypothetical protein [Verrucomicrobiae bacterium]